MKDTEGTEYGSVCNTAKSGDTALGNLNFNPHSRIPTIPQLERLIVIAQDLLIRASLPKANGVPTHTHMFPALTLSVSQSIISTSRTFLSGATVQRDSSLFRTLGAGTRYGDNNELM